MFLGSVLILLLGSSAVIAESTFDKTWKKLLHYDSKAHFVDPTFYYTPDGQKNPKQELAATLKHIETESDATPEKLRFACRFPARRRLIEKELKISPKVDCPSHQEWLYRYRPDSLSFIYTSQFVGNPVSSFGHTFLRFDRGRFSNLLGLSLSYFARADNGDNPFVYALKGMSGGYEGFFEFDHFYPKAQRYGSRENRDIWEYELNFTEEERVRVLEHAKELSQHGQTKYYFLDRNCAFFLLTLLDVAREDLHTAQEGDKFFITPQDTIKILSRHQLISKESFRPSLRRKANFLYTSLNFKQREVVKKGLAEEIPIEEISDAQVLSAMTTILAMRESSEKPQDERKLLFQKVTDARAKLPIDDNTSFPTNDQSSNPLRGHETYMAHIGFAQTDLTSSLQIGLRPAIHAVEEMSAGFLPNTQLVFLETILRIEELDEKSKIRLRKISFIDVKSLPSYSVVNNAFSWSAQLALLPTLGSECIDCRALRIAGNIGYSTDLHPGLLVYALVGPTIDGFTPEKKIKMRMGPSLSSGVISSIASSLIFKLENRFDYFVLDPYNRESIWTTDASLTWHASKNTNISIQGLKAINLRHSEFNSNDFVLRSAWHF